jgi:hypothetical protein
VARVTVNAMNELENILLSTGLGFIGTIIGASVTWWATKRANATAATLKLYDDWNSESMLTSRHEAQEVKWFFDRDEKNTLDLRFRSLSPETRAHIWKIIHFYEKLYVMIKNNQCNNRLIPSLFGETFYWWYLNCFQAKLLPSENRSASIRIRSLKNWLDKNASHSEISRWIKRESETTKSDYKVIVGKSGPTD